MNGCMNDGVGADAVVGDLVIVKGDNWSAEEIMHDHQKSSFL